ncbi:MAG: hypothetical protein FWE34_03735 [Defluviitaleaceae bacterium]|nr:hypothetical protein [Defluviitaleaceae bacterium]
MSNSFDVSAQFDAANKSIAEGVSVIENYNSNLTDTCDIIMKTATDAVSLLGPKGFIIGQTTQIGHELGWWQDISGGLRVDYFLGEGLIDSISRDPEVINRMFEPFANIGEAIVKKLDSIPESLHGISDVSIEEMRNLDHSWSGFWGSVEQGIGEVTEAITESHRAMADTSIDVIREMDSGWGDFRSIIGQMTDESNKVIIESYKNMSEELTSNVITPLGDEWNGFFGLFSQGAKAANKAATDSFDIMSEDVSGGALSRMGEHCDMLWERMQEGAEGTTGAIKSLFGGLSSEIRNPINGIISIVSEMVERITTGLNGVIGGINSIGFDLPPFLGGGSFRPNLAKIPPVHIPMLARGGIVDRPTLALIGERGKEAVMPLENNTGWIADLANTIGAVVGAQLSINRANYSDYAMMDSNRPIKLYLDGRTVAEGMLDDLVEVAKRRDVQLSPIFG